MAHQTGLTGMSDTGFLFFAIQKQSEYAEVFFKDQLAGGIPFPVLLFLFGLALAATEFGAIVGLGFLVANTFDIAVNPNIPHPAFYGVISFHLVGIGVSCLIMVLSVKHRG